MNARLPSSIAQTITKKDSTVFTSGNSQAVRIPKDFQFTTKQVSIEKRGNELVIKPKFRNWAEILANLPPWTEEESAQWDKVMATIEEGRRQPAQQRDWAALFGDDNNTTKSRTRKTPSNALKTLAPNAKKSA